MVSVRRESGSGLAGWFLLRILHEVVVEMLVGLQSLKAQLGWRTPFQDGALTQLWAGGLSPSPRGPLQMALPDMAAGFPQRVF